MAFFTYMGNDSDVQCPADKPLGPASAWTIRRKLIEDDQTDYMLKTVEDIVIFVLDS